MDTDSRGHLLNWEDIVVNEARSWKGTPYVARQCVKGVGADCGTFLHHCYSLVFPLGPMPRDYAVDWARHSDEELYLNWIASYADEVDRPIYGGLGTWLFGRAYAHGGFVTDKGTIIHAYGRTEMGKVKEDSPRFFAFRGGKTRDVKWWYPKQELIDKWPSYYQSP
jgi:cell wall-associated NlpC family hydrolase